MSGHYDVAGRTVLITGAARGIGAELARRLAAKGARLALAGLQPDLLEGVAKEVDGVWFETDVRDPAAVQKAVDATAVRYGGIDVVVANAGIGPVGSVAGMDLKTGKNIIDINLLGVWYTLRAAAPHVTARRGYLLAVASMAAVAHPPLLGMYGASKAGVVALTDAMRIEMRGTGAKVGVVLPSFVETDMVTEQSAVLDERLGLGGRRGNSTIGSPMPLAKLVDLVEEGVERRARRIVAPSYLRGAPHLQTAVVRLMGLVPQKYLTKALAAEAQAPLHADATPDLPA